jgi:hypothetical protein
MPNRKTFLILIFSFFLFRLTFGLLRSQILETDQLQTYLIGLKCYTTHTWPFFGPDVNGSENSFRSQIPGALEGLLIGLPFYILPIPEAPFILLNLLSIAGVGLLAWYIAKRLPGLPYAWIFAWIAIVPWSIHESTTIINPAFTFLPSILFFIGFMESLPWFTLNLVSPALSNAAMGLSLFWIMQFHFSYVYLIPLAAFSLGVQLWKTRRPSSLLYFILGSLPTLAFIIPTYLQYGIARGNVSSGFVVPFNWSNVREFWTILARFLSLVCFELPRFIGVTTKSRIDFLLQHWLLFVPGAILWIGGLLQPFLLLGGWFKQKTFGPAWRELKWLIAVVFAMVYASFWFTVKMPLSHIYYVFFPLIMTYSCYCWMMFRNNARWRLTAKIFVILGVIFQLGYAVAVAPQDSIYPKRDRIKQAIDSKDYRIFSERRPESLY